MASWETLCELHGLVAANLVRLLSTESTVSVELLNVARVLLQQSAVTTRALTAPETALMEELKGLHLQKLLAAVRAEKPSATILAEAGRTLASMDYASLLGELEGAEKPFELPTFAAGYSP